MIGDMIALLKLLKEITNKKEEDKLEFTKEIFFLFKKVHEDYLMTFRKYQDEIESSNPLKLSSIIKEIEEDSLFSQNLRDELSDMLIRENNDSPSKFIVEILKYLKYPETIFRHTIQPWSNCRRNSLIETLYLIEKLTYEVIVVSGLLSDIQNSRLEIGRPRIDNTPEHLILNLDLIIRNHSSESFLSDISKEKKYEIDKKLDEIKRYLAVECINFIIKETQQNYRLIANTHWQLKFKSSWLS